MRLVTTVLVAAGVSLAVTSEVLRRHRALVVSAQTYNPNLEAFLNKFIRIQMPKLSPDVQAQARAFVDGTQFGSTIPPHLRRRVEEAARRAREVIEEAQQSGPRVAP